ncbi:hypothetical protein [Fibrobacter sp.]|uniref:hypothetical protein n=1 Tax=Fibrobacter sp. TaxID=35828 RepID=UPI00388F1C6F
MKNALLALEGVADDENGRKDDMQQEQGGAPLNTKEGTPLRMSLVFKEHNEESLQSPS